MASRHRAEKIIAVIACPRCGAKIGEPWRNPVPHQSARGPEDRRAQPMRPHNERRLAWVESKRT